MAIKRPKPKEIIAKLRQVEVLMGQGMPWIDAICQISVTEQTYYRWKKEVRWNGHRTTQETKAAKERKWTSAVGGIQRTSLQMSPAKLPRLVSPHMIHPNTGFYLKRAPKCRQILCLRIKLTHQLFFSECVYWYGDLWERRCASFDCSWHDCPGWYYSLKAPGT